MAGTTTISEIYGDFLHNCVCCGTTDIRFWGSKNFQYTNRVNDQAFQIYRCNHCGSGFLNHPPHNKWLESIYQHSGQALNDAVSLREVLETETDFPNRALDAKRIVGYANLYNTSNNNFALDIGSGFGFYTHALRKLAYWTVSINPGKLENQVFTEMNGDEPLAIMFEQYQCTAQFGIVIMSQVLEHLLEPDRAVKKVHQLLESGGVLACAVPNYNSFLVKLLGTKDNACLWIPEHVNYFTVDGLSALLKRNGFKIVKTQQITRIPFNALSKRLGLTGFSAKVVNYLLKYLQIPFVHLMNVLGLGIYINVYAIKK
jgi:SAM-dependent methyltransferase